MPDEADELILKMQHLEAQAREQEKARSLQGGGDRLKTAAQKVAFEARQELAKAEEDLAKDPADHDAKARAVKARAKLNFALDRMDEAERRDWEALQAEARAEAHGQMADDPLFNKT